MPFKDLIAILPNIPTFQNSRALAKPEGALKVEAWRV